MIVPQAGMIPHRKGLPEPEAAMGIHGGAHHYAIPRQKKRGTPEAPPSNSYF